MFILILDCLYYYFYLISRNQKLRKISFFSLLKKLVCLNHINFIAAPIVTVILSPHYDIRLSKLNIRIKLFTFSN